MTGKTILLLSAATLAMAACAPKADTANTSNTATTMNMSEMNGMAMSNDTAAAKPAISQEQAFVNSAAASDAFELATSKLALDVSQSAPVKAFANQMIKVHTASTAKLKALTAGMHPALTPNPTLTPTQQTTLDGLKGKTGGDFDTAFAIAQVAAHQDTLDGLKFYSTAGNLPELRKFAGDLIPTVAAHLNMAKALK